MSTVDFGPTLFFPLMLSFSAIRRLNQGKNLLQKQKRKGQSLQAVRWTGQLEHLLRTAAEMLEEERVLKLVCGFIRCWKTHLSTHNSFFLFHQDLQQNQVWHGQTSAMRRSWEDSTGTRIVKYRITGPRVLGEKKNWVHRVGGSRKHFMLNTLIRV